MARDLGDEEKALWRKVVETITPLSHPNPNTVAFVKTANKALPLQNIKPARGISVAARNRDKKQTAAEQAALEQTPIEQTASYDEANPSRADLAAALSRPISKTPTPRRRNIAFGLNNSDSHKIAHNGLDGHWEKRFTKGVVIPDISIDLHGAGLQSAYNRLDSALEQARAQKLRVILLVTGRDRKYDRASGEGRGGIRAVMSDWLAASRHSDYIASVRKAHARHGGAGALYIILRK